MSPGRLIPWLIGAVLVLLLAGTVGWSLGSGSADGRDDARSAREQGYEEGFRLVYGQAREVTAGRGLKAGAVRGKLVGAKAGSREGTGIGAGNAAIEQAVASQKAAESAASAAQAEIAARSANCGIVPAAPSWCPTGDELSSYRSAVKAAREAADKAKKQKEDQGGGDDRP